MTFSRRRVVLVTVTLLLLLDLGRSLYARRGAATPTRLWSAGRSYAQAIAWPPGTDQRADTPPGERVYVQHCALCHGPEGRGNGPAAPSLHPRPRDFTGGVFKLKSTGENQPPTLIDVRDTIQRGMPGSSMPGWADILSDADTDAVADYIRALGPHKEWAATAPTSLVPPGVMTSASADRGGDLYAELGCASCHGREGRGDGASAKELKDVWNQPDAPRDLTAPWTFRGGNGFEALYARIAHGMSGTPMPGYAEVAAPEQIASVVAYVRAIARRPAWEAGGTFDGPGQSPDPVQRGAYLVHAGMCGLCHTPVDPNGIYLANTHYLAGGMKVEAGAHGIFFTRNLTPDPDTGLGKWSVEQIATALRTGHAPERRLNYWGMPWMVLGALTAEDATAIASYLKTLPAVHNLIPMPLHYGFIETVLRKLSYVWPAVVPERGNGVTDRIEAPAQAKAAGNSYSPILPPPRLAYHAGNFGYEDVVSFPRDLPERVLIWVQLGVLALGVVAFGLAQKRRRGRRNLSRGLRTIVTLLLLVVGASLVMIYRYPALDLVPTQPVVTAFGSAIPDVKTDGLAPHEAALLQRGRYLYGIASCPYCHNGNGAGGGKVNWSVFGTTWARNLTAHPTGLANWSDEAVLRALVSGVSRDGRPLHWQAMMWDHISNYSVEDQHALLAYVRALPPVDRASPRPVPPGSNDCAGDTFWIGATNSAPGCQ